MRFEDRIVRAPRAIDAERGRDALRHVPDASGAMVDLLTGAAGSSPYLSDLIRRDGAWLAQALTMSPEDARQQILTDAETAEAGGLNAALRQAKRRMALLVALADLGGVWSLEEVTKSLTQLADAALQRALIAAFIAEAGRGKLPGLTDDDADTAGGLTFLAMGKMGAFELNYSSDIDLICLFDETRFEPSDYAEARTGFVRIVRRVTKTLSERTADGYVFRTDLRLRPDASVTPVAISMEAAERYYESLGRTWERAAYIKARPAAGDLAAGQRFLDTLRPFIWRRHLDFAAIQDAHDMRLRIRDHKGLSRPISHLGHDVKLGQGGIREIEFFTQTRQIIAGGRDPDLRVRRTLDGLSRLAEKGWIGGGDATSLANDYVDLRTLEHRIQMVADQQTHALPQTEEEFARIAALSSREPDDFSEEIVARFQRVERLTEGFFAPGGKPGAAASQEKAPPLPSTSQEIINRWQSYPALRSKRAEEIFARMQPGLLARLGKARNPEEAIVHFDGFLRGLPAGVQVFSLFEVNPHLLDLVVDLVDTTPALGQYLSQNSAVFDAVIGGDFFSEWPGCAALKADLSDALAQEADYEARLDRARLWQREWQFRAGVHHLRGLIDAVQAGRQHADLAEATLTALWPVVVEHFAEKHGPPPGNGATVLGMGSLGARRLNAVSDLDLIVIYDGAGQEASDGRRSLPTRTYYARLTQAMVTALSAPTAQGRLYEVDMRLRPSGRQGPVATGLESYKSYQSTEAWTWEHLALTRARVIAGDTRVGDEVEAFRRSLLSKPRPRAETLSDVATMRRRLAEAKPSAGALDVKAGPGRLTDIELLAETATLLTDSGARRIEEQMERISDAFSLGADAVATLTDTYERLWSVRAVSRLLTPGEIDIRDAGAGATAFLTRGTGHGTLEALITDLDSRAAEAAHLIDTAIGSNQEAD